METTKKPELLDQIYKAGIFAIPSQGRYKVYIQLQNKWINILEKSIECEEHKLLGNNHLPIFLARYKNIPYMDFEVVPFKKTKEIWFIYKNGVITDTLVYIKEFDVWLGKLFWNGVFVFYFWFVPNTNYKGILKGEDIDSMMEKIKNKLGDALL